eukprot:Lithocolla_globosa_v1_NODE_1667_length_2409_cov_9.852229.p2 type:complete len:168 gc:universal NODE_1667_length_2409_cov_9.852229:1628-2131(+)
MITLTREGYGVENPSLALSHNIIDRLFNYGIIGMHTAWSLVRFVFIVIGEAFALRGGEEHRNFLWSDVREEYNHELDMNSLLYVPRVIKNNQGGMKHKKVDRKPKPLYDDPNVQERRSWFQAIKLYVKLLLEAGCRLVLMGWWLERFLEIVRQVEVRHIWERPSNKG